MTWLDDLLGQGPPRVTNLDPTLERLCAGLPVEDVQALREERAAILEHLAGLPRSEAERRAGLA